jgi:hypothetical protein
MQESFLRQTYRMYRVDINVNCKTHDTKSKHSKEASRWKLAGYLSSPLTSLIFIFIIH